MSQEGPTPEPEVVKYHLLPTQKNRLLRKGTGPSSPVLRWVSMASPVLPAFRSCFSGAALISADLFKINPIRGEFNIFLQFYGLGLNRDLR